MRTYPQFPSGRMSSASSCRLSVRIMVRLRCAQVSTMWLITAFLARACGARQKHLFLSFNIGGQVMRLAEPSALPGITLLNLHTLDSTPV